MPTPNFDAMSKTELEAYVVGPNSDTNIAKAQAELDWIEVYEVWTNQFLDEGNRSLGQLIGMFAAGPRRGFMIPPPPPVI